MGGGGDLTPYPLNLTPYTLNLTPDTQSHLKNLAISL